MEVLMVVTTFTLSWIVLKWFILCATFQNVIFVHMVLESKKYVISFSATNDFKSLYCNVYVYPIWPSTKFVHTTYSLRVVTRVHFKKKSIFFMITLNAQAPRILYTLCVHIRIAYVRQSGPRPLPNRQRIWFLLQNYKYSRCWWILLWYLRQIFWRLL